MPVQPTKLAQFYSITLFANIWAERSLETHLLLEDVLQKKIHEAQSIE